MKVGRLKIAKLMVDELEQSQDSALLAKKLAAYLLDSNRVNELEPLLRDMIYYRQQKGVVEATLTTAHPFNPASKSLILTMIRSNSTNAKKIILNQKMDKSLLGGLNLMIGSEDLVDLTIRTKLNRFKQLTT
jgi:F0F1-type ATP synthase delta subunit